MRFLRFVDRVFWLLWAALFLTVVGMSFVLYVAGSGLSRFEAWLYDARPLAKTLPRTG